MGDYEIFVLATLFVFIGLGIHAVPNHVVEKIDKYAENPTLKNFINALDSVLGIVFHMIDKFMKLVIRVCVVLAVFWFFIEFERRFPEIDKHRLIPFTPWFSISYENFKHTCIVSALAFCLWPSEPLMIVGMSLGYVFLTQLPPYDILNLASILVVVMLYIFAIWSWSGLVFSEDFCDWLLWLIYSLGLDFCDRLSWLFYSLRLHVKSFCYCVLLILCYMLLILWVLSTLLNFASILVVVLLYILAIWSWSRQV